MARGRLGGFIKKGREKKGWNQKTLAGKVAKTTSTISQIESGQLIPGEKLLACLTRALDIDFELAWLLGQTEKARPGLPRKLSLANLKNYENYKVEHVAGEYGSPEENVFRVGDFDNYDKAVMDQFVPLPHVKPHGMPLHSQSVEVPECEAAYFAFNKIWLSQIGGESGKFFIEAADDSMSPVIEAGDLVLIDQNEAARQIKPGRIYVVVSNGEAALKRVYWGQEPGSLILISENSAVYPPVKFYLKAGESWPIIGQARWLGREL